jgi:hypothetical protein
MAKDAVLKRNEKKPFDQLHQVKKLSLVITIVDAGKGDILMYEMSKVNISTQFIQRGEGTASKNLYDILGVTDNRKEIIYSLVQTDYVPTVMKTLDNLFKQSQRRPGIAFSISLSSIAGITAYRFISETI